MNKADHKKEINNIVSKDNFLIAVELEKDAAKEDM